MRSSVEELGMYPMASVAIMFWTERGICENLPKWSV